MGNPHQSPTPHVRSGPRYRPVLLLLAILLLALPAAAQSVSATLTGQVTDPAGGAVADAVVTVRHQKTSALRQVITGKDGRYTLNLLRPGRYTVRVVAAGFAPVVREGIGLPLQGTVTLDLPLSPTLVETVTVRGEGVLLDPAATAGGLFVGSTEIADLPLSGRVVTDLALLDASLRPVAPGTFFGEQAAVFTANGQGGRANSFLVDGLDNNDHIVGSRTNLLYSQEVVQEFRVMTDGFAPEFGRASGGVLNILTRSGGNDLAGGFFLQSSPAQLNEPGDFIDALPLRPDNVEVLDRYQWGGHLSGPIRRDKAFYFLAVEPVQSYEVIPFVGIERDDVGAGESDPVGGRFRAPLRDLKTFAKFNAIPAANHHLEVRFSWDEAEVHGLNIGGRVTPEAGHWIEESDHQVAVSLTSTITPRWFHEVRLLAGHSQEEQRAYSDRPGVDRPSGVFGGNHLQRKESTETRFQLVDNLSWFHDRHAVKFGISLQHLSVKISTDFNRNGVFLYTTDRPFEPGDSRLGSIGEVGVDDDGDGTVDEFPDFDSYPLVFQLIQGTPSAKFDTALAAAFVQDQFRVTPNLRLTYGLRYDLDTFRLDDRYAIRPGPPNGGASPDRDNLAPRLAFTWTPRRDLLIRGGIGLFYDKVVLGFPAVSVITGEQTLGLLFLGPLGRPIDETWVEENGVEPLRDELLSDPRYSLFFTTGDTLDTPYTVQANLGFEMRVARSTVFSANMVRSRGHHLPLLRDLNPVDRFLLLGAEQNKLPRHRIQEIGSIASVETMGNSWYNALELALDRRENNLRFRASYVLSRAEDEGPDPLKGGISLPFDSDDIPGERGRSDNDERHRFVLSGTWESPFWGLTLSPVIAYGSGIPFTVLVAEDLNGDGLGNDRPCTSIAPDRPCTGSNARWRLGRNTGAGTSLDRVNRLRRQAGLGEIDRLEEPDYFQVDLRLTRRFAVGRTRLEGYLQVFNLFNRVNGGPVDGRISSRTFGEPIGLLGPPRTTELGLRVIF